MKRGELRQRLAERGWFASLDQGLAAAILDAGRASAVARGEALYHPEDDPGGIYGVVSGGILLSAGGRGGVPVPWHIMRNGGWFGDGSVTARQKRWLMAEACEESVLLHLPLAEVERLRAAFPGASQAYARLAAEGEALFLAIIADLLIRGADRRIAAVLLRVTGAEAPGWRGGSPGEPLAADRQGVTLTQTLLAELSNASHQTVARFVERAGRAGWIDWSYGRVRILDAGQLAALAAGR
jgi:CRP-like cAMP-binding protein